MSTDTTRLMRHITQFRENAVHPAAPAAATELVFENKLCPTEKTTDLFYRERRVHNRALSHERAVLEGAPYNFEHFRKLTREYGKLLDYLHRSTRYADLMTNDLHMDKLELLGSAFYDALTGIYNRAYFDNMLTHAVAAAARSGGPFSVLMIDIDHFKQYNDTYGHSQGDACLREVAQSFAASVVRANDFAARYGGEEFAIVLPGTDENGARIVAERALQTVRDLGIPHAKSSTAPCVTISIGVATAAAIPGPSCGMDLVKRADTALYESKKDGRNRLTHKIC